MGDTAAVTFKLHVGRGSGCCTAKLVGPGGDTLGLVMGMTGEEAARRLLAESVEDVAKVVADKIDRPTVARGRGQ